MSIDGYRLKRKSEMDNEARTLLQQVAPSPYWSTDEMEETPARWRKMMLELSTPEKFNFTTFENPGNDEMVVVQGIPFASMCAHHLLPFTGVCHIAYIPGKLIAGLSKLPRLVKACSKGPHNQEGLTEEIARVLDETLDPVGAAVIMSAEHTCMTIRGVQVPGTRTTTSSMKGAFADHSRQARSEFLSILSLGHG